MIILYVVGLLQIFVNTEKEGFMRSKGKEVIRTKLNILKPFAYRQTSPVCAGFTCRVHSTALARVWPCRCCGLPAALDSFCSWEVLWITAQAERWWAGSGTGARSEHQTTMGRCVTAPQPQPLCICRLNKDDPLGPWSSNQSLLSSGIISIPFFINKTKITAIKWPLSLWKVCLKLCFQKPVSLCQANKN